jgi:hypothetical protein
MRKEKPLQYVIIILIIKIFTIHVLKMQTSYTMMT